MRKYKTPDLYMGIISYIPYNKLKIMAKYNNMKKAKLSLSTYMNYRFRWIPYYYKQKLTWKDKFGTPRCEREPYFKFEWLWFGLYGVWGDDQYWEQWLWIHKYHNGDVEKAKSNWGWVDFDTKNSTWIDY